MGADLGALLRRHRQAARLTLEALAERSGVSARAISDMERGRARGPQARTIAALADALRLAGAPREALLTAARDGRLRRWPDLPGARDLPPRAPDFVGRHAELADLELLADPSTRSPLVVIAGAGGLGKSALAVEAAHRVAPGYPGGVLHLDLRGLDPHPAEPGDLLGRALSGLGVRDVPSGVPDRAAAYRRALAEHPVLVVLDNARAEAQVRPLLAGEGRSTVVITSRRLLTGLAHARRTALLPMPEDDAVALLALASGGATAAGPEHDDALRQVARLCGRYPLALRIAANRLSTRPAWTAADLAARLGRSERRLAQLVAGDVEVAGVLALSYDQLDADARRLFRRLSLIAAGADPETAAVAADLPVGEVELLIDELVELSLLHALPGDRAGFHDLVAVYAAERLAAEEPPEDVRAATLAVRSWLLNTACAAGRLFEPDPVASVPPQPRRTFRDLSAAERWLTVEADNWLAAFRATADEGDHRTVVAVAESMHWYSDRRSHWSGWLEVYGRSARAAEQLGDRRLEAVHRNYLAWALVVHKRYQEATETVALAAALAREAGDVRQEAWARRYAAELRERRDLMDAETEEHHRRAAELFERAGDVEGSLGSLGGVARLLGAAGRHREALALGDQVLERIAAHRTRIPDHILDWEASTALRDKAELLLRLGDLPAAESVARETVAVAERLGVPFHHGGALRVLAHVLRTRGDVTQARAALLRARELFDAGGRPLRVAEVDRDLADLDRTPSGPPAAVAEGPPRTTEVGPADGNP
ncbi:ATP-binding protein [Nakamurella endophytica]|uniref:HTH cro/C1-type domain-containing protein n=1 Tax=Nakamurella endophytica TaxID=1748367 RepID=A0A917T7N5_9ACTN|nr:helix-turn-helix transcriptional regulator [Nakamurella endophytica]GGM13709.1 hypothetical protein GCM10011594_36990 [Nakamurella endophytica]